MKRRSTIAVAITQEMIDAGRAADCYSCPVALALGAATGWQWHVMREDARLESETGKHVTWRFPLAVFKWIGRYDLREAAEPMTFMLPGRFGDMAWLRARGVVPEAFE